jgi:hypothetical protein
MTFECKNNTISKYYSSQLFLTLDLDVNINRDEFALGIIPLVSKNGLYDTQMDNLFRSLLVTPTIPTIKIVNPMVP